MGAFLCLSCQRTYKKSREELLPNAELKVIDSIQLEPDTIPHFYFDLAGFRKGYMLALSQTREVFLLKSNGKLISKIGKNGKAPGEYMDPVGLKFLSQDSIFLSDYTSGKIMLYNGGGHLLNSWEVTENDPHNSFPVFFGYLNVTKDNAGNLKFEYLGRSDKKSFVTTPAYYKQARLLSVFNPLFKQYDNYIPYETGSPYLGDKYFLSPLDPCIKKLVNGYYAVVFAHEDAIYVYDTGFKMIERIDGMSNYFPEPDGVSFDKKDSEFDVDNVKYNVKRNGLNYLSLHSFPSKDSSLILVKQYKAPVNDDNLPNDINAARAAKYKRDSYLQFYDLKGNKLYRDIIQPQQLSYMVYADGFDFMVFQRNLKLTDKNILYVAKLVPAN